MKSEMTRRKARAQSSTVEKNYINDQIEYRYLDVSIVNERRFVGTTGRVFDKQKRLFCPVTCIAMYGLTYSLYRVTRVHMYSSFTC